MPVESIVLETRTNDQLYNSSNFYQDENIQKSPNLIGSTMERLRITQIVQVSWYSEASPSNSFTFSGSDPAIVIKRQRGKWRDDGVSIGDGFSGTVVVSESNISFDGIVKSMTGDIIVIDKTSQPTIPSGEYTDARFDYYTDITSIIYKWGIIENDEQANYISKVTDNEQGYYRASVTTSWEYMEPLGRIRDWVTGEARVRKLTAPDQYTNIFEIQHNFVVSPYYREDYKQFLEGEELPDLFNGFNSIKYVSEIDLRTSISDPDSSKSVLIDQITGSVGWFDENFNGFNSEYRLESISFKDSTTGAEIESVNSSGITAVTIVCKKLSGNFDPSARFGVYCSFMPDADDYTNTKTTAKENMMYDNAVHTSNASFISTGVILHEIQSVTDLDTITITFKTQFSAAQITRIIAYDSPQFLIAVMLGDVLIDFANSDKVMLKAMSGAMINYVDLTGIIDSNSVNFEIWGHDYVAPTTNFVGWNEDGILCNMSFDIDKSRNAVINSITQSFVAFNQSTGHIIELDEYNIPLQNSQVVNGDQIISVDTTKGYSLMDGDKFNYAKVNGSSATYTIESGQKITWQDWLLVDSEGVFVNASKRASNYNNASGYTPRVMYKINMSGLGTNGNYGTDDVFIISPAFNIYDYDLPVDWVGLIETFEPDTLADLGGGVLTNKKTIFRVTWEKTNVTITDIADFYAIHRIEETGQQGFEIHELSTIRPFPPSNPLQPLNTETQLHMYVDSGKVITECFIDPKYIDVSNVNLSARIKGTAITFVGGKQLEDGTFKTTELGEMKTIDE